ncbi:MAG: biotin--[acetyl-CoA-carboxylase] ligase [Oscillospiraceae bacterium]
MIREMLFLEETSSTNAYCREHWNELEDGAVVYSTNQLKGRGRLGRTWVNAPGMALYYSEVIKQPIANASCLPLAASLAVEDALERMYGIAAQVKWPNDLLLNNKKLVGILFEGVEGGYIFGVGINLSQSGEYFENNNLVNATSIFAETGEKPRDIGALALAISESFQAVLACFSKEGFAALRGEYRARCVNLLREVHTDKVKGVATDIDLEGRLIVRTESGETAVFTGEVTVEGIYDSPEKPIEDDVKIYHKI